MGAVALCGSSKAVSSGSGAGVGGPGLLLPVFTFLNLTRFLDRSPAKPTYPAKPKQNGWRHNRYPTKVVSWASTQTNQNNVDHTLP